jgi:hypothetical protein
MRATAALGEPVPAAEQLRSLRWRLAATENKATLQSIGEECEELSWIAPENLLAEIGALKKRIVAKAARLGGNLEPVLRSMYERNGGGPDPVPPP